MRPNTIKTLLGLVLLATLVGCSKLTMENYDKITVGMAYDDVINLLGKPDKCDDVLGLRSCSWSEGDRSVMVNFAGNQVLVFSSKNLK